MICCPSILRHACLIAIATLVWLGTEAEAREFHFVIADVSPQAAAAFRAKATRSFSRVNRDHGCLYKGALRIIVSADYRISKALIPAWRGSPGRMEFPARRVRNGSSAVIHEFVHVCAANQNRFLAEGLAVYLQSKLSTGRAFPNFGRSLHRLAAPYRSIDLARLDAIGTPTRLLLIGELSGREAYLVAGSFVGYLIETHGLERFRRLYALTPLRPKERGGSGKVARYTAIYGRSLQLLVKNWRAFIAAHTR